MIALATPAIGNGPFCIVLDAIGDLFEALEPQQPARVDAEQIAIGALSIPLRDARAWDATLPGGKRALHLAPALAAILQPYAHWPPPDTDTPWASSMARLLAQGARALLEALEQRADLAEAAQSLAGLGSGLTPAGDDFLLGTIAALWLLGEREATPTIARASAARTTALSGAFLTAAAQGQFIEPWHDLALALHGQDEARSREALLRIAAYGASSGRDALAGFTATLLRHAHPGEEIMLSAAPRSTPPGVRPPDRRPLA
ncbi:MAG: DUF2877 domain-containing protein [Roseiflexaceae bacterium]